MKGSYQIIIQNRRIRYEFTIRRNITIIRGDSATGKTQMIEMLASYNLRPDESGIDIQSSVPCIVLTQERWETNLSAINNSIVFIDEGNRFTSSREFADSVRSSENYYVIVTRNALPALPYSTNEIYGIRESEKGRGLKKIYNEFYPLYPNSGRNIIDASKRSMTSMFSYANGKRAELNNPDSVFTGQDTEKRFMLHIHFGSMDGEIYDPATYFINQYEDEWIISELGRKMIEDVDKSTVIGPRVIDSPFLGGITPRELSGGVKTLLLMAFDDGGKIFNASACGDNCAKWILEIAERKELTVTLHNIMDFGDGEYRIHILNNNRMAHGFSEYLDCTLDYL